MPLPSLYRCLEYGGSKVNGVRRKRKRIVNGSSAFPADEQVVRRPEPQHVGDLSQTLLEADRLDLVAQVGDVVGGDEDVVPRVRLRPEEALESRMLPEPRLGVLARDVEVDDRERPAGLQVLAGAVEGLEPVR